MCAETKATGCPWVASTYQRRGDSCRTPNQAGGWPGIGLLVLQRFRRCKSRLTAFSGTLRVVGG